MHCAPSTAHNNATSKMAAVLPTSAKRTNKGRFCRAKAFIPNNNTADRLVSNKHGKKSPVFWWFYQTVNVLKMPRSRSVFSFRNSQGKLGVHNLLTPGKYAVYFTFSSTRKTWLNSALSLVNRTFYQTVNVRKISRSWLVFQLRKRQGQLGIHHHLTEGKYAVHVTLSSTWKTGLNSSFSLVNQKFYPGKPKKARVSGNSIKLTGIRK